MKLNSFMSLTQKDLNDIEQVVDERIDEKIKNLPTKDEFFNKMDEVMGELKSIRENTEVLTHQVSDHEDRITKVEHKLSIQTS